MILKESNTGNHGQTNGRDEKGAKRKGRQFLASHVVLDGEVLAPTLHAQKPIERANFIADDG